LHILYTKHSKQHNFLDQDLHTLYSIVSYLCNVMSCGRTLDELVFDSS